MKMSVNQTKFIGLTMELELKTREYKMLCEKLEQLKKDGIKNNDERLVTLKEEFLKNNEEIKRINLELKNLKEIN